jgi:alkylhydroperoxidase family enzyme
MRRSMMAIAGLASVLCAMNVVAADAPIARIPVPTDPATNAAVKETVDAAKARGGQPINLQYLMLLAPPLAKASQEAAYAIRFDLKVPRPYRELTILRTVQNWHGDYEFRQHQPMALSCGYTQAQIDGLRNWQNGSLFDPKQRAVLAYVDEVTKQPGSVDNATFTELQKYFNPNEIVELTMTATTYMGTSAFTNAMELQTETDGRLTVLGKC